MIKALVFDFDGLILDTETAIYKATQEIYKEYGAELPISIWANLAGTQDDGFDLTTHLAEQSGVTIDKEALLKDQRQRINAYIERETILPGVLPLLEMGKQLGLKIALATSSGNQWAKRHLKRLGIIDFFEAIIEADDVEKVKPDPELFTKAVEALQVKPDEAIAFEDSYHGMIAAKRAGLYCVVVPNEVTQSLDFSQADRQLKSLADITAEELIQAFSEKE
ncbi:HAD superfamily hydrolase (TIGR01509 family) [Pullulanibacillus pueri]|uniref:HAD family hydrolase n=1 Tax=Pullulanibacillus pueri TaxID=1437324 RepID=A0A8J3EME0_9BACL|nr:HAD family hydrolase [Pullulanibacillus pueri]MBM7683573.1 HAD superfamily hydrolase (TIGR01509 family) [Pullulanibacillus pueri]GGH84477.1 hypothetical protein GCM10007096_27640 [Pullulanibacillus pueri]